MTTKFYTTLCALFISAFAFGQEVKEVGDTTFINVGKIKLLVIDPDSSSSDTTGNLVISTNNKPSFWGGLDVGVNFLGLDGMNSLNSFDDSLSLWEMEPGRSMYFGLNLKEVSGNLIQEKVFITSGLGVSYTSFGFKENVTLQTDANTTTPVLDTLRNYTKNKLRYTSLQLPVLLSFKTGKKSNFSVGVVGQIRIGSKMKQKYQNGSDKVEKVKIKDDFNFTDFGYYAQVRFQYKQLKLFTNYGLSPVFKDGSAPGFSAFTFGVSFL